MIRNIDNESDFVAWSKRSEPGEKVVYHTGLLMRDRQYTDRGSVPVVGSRLCNLAKSVMAIAEAGEIALVQKRLDNYNCEYLAVKL